MAEDSHNGKRWLLKSVAILLTAVAVVILISAILFFASKFSGPTTTPFSWNWLWNVLVVLFIVWIIMWIIRGAFGWPHRRHWHDHYDHEKTIVRRRYARGEITKKQYQEMIKDLDDTKD